MHWKVAHRAAAETLLKGAGADQRPHVVLMGPAGVGKTIVARAYAQQIREARPGAIVHWVSATASARDIPFGAFSHLTDVVSRTDPAATFRAARAMLCPDGREVIVMVDDAHLLDGYSATLVHQLAASTSAQVLVTCRTGAAAPGAITALWKDGSATRVDLQSLTKTETTQLLERVLNGPVRAETAERIFALSRGNPLYLRHLIEGAVQQGSLCRVEGHWQLRGPAPLSRELTDLVDQRLSDLPPTANKALQYLAVEEPLSVSLLARLTTADAIELAEDAGAVRVVERGTELVVYSGHPLYAERLRQSLGRLAARRLRTDVVRLLDTEYAAGLSDRLRIIALALDSDLPPKTSSVIKAAFEALYLNDLPLTERLARAAVQRSNAVMARIALAHALCWQGRGDEAESTLAAIDPDALAEFELLTWVLARASNQFWVLGQADEAAQWLGDMRARLPAAASQVMLDGLAAQFAMNLGQLPTCLDLAAQVLRTDGASDEAVAWAASSAALANARTGGFENVDAQAQLCLQTQSPDGVRYTAGLARTQTAIMQGRADEAFGIATDYLTSAGFRPGRAQAHVVLGHVMIAQGNLDGAVTTLRSATAHYSETGDAWQSLNLMLLTTALGQQGHGSAAAETLQQAAATHDRRTALHRPELHQARAWARAAARDVSGAIAAAHDAVQESMRTGQIGQALLAHHDAVRFGDSSAARAIARLDERLDCVLSSLVLAQARGLADGNGVELHRVAIQFEVTGMFGAAADAAAQAALAYAARGFRRDELKASAYAVQLRRRCGGLSTPALDVGLQPLPLTGRERQIAFMVAERKSNKAIAQHLKISVRTVEAHVYRACAKLNVANREQLGDAVLGAAGT